MSCLTLIGTIIAAWGSQNGGGWVLGGGVWSNDSILDSEGVLRVTAGRDLILWSYRRAGRSFTNIRALCHRQPACGRAGLPSGCQPPGFI
ncbi:MAG: hypothetical protein PHO37_00860 [Kiritimatiellae bacterium]|nr:hypothetical protein [Kiritimatiellia bacterium]